MPPRTRNPSGGRNIDATSPPGLPSSQLSDIPSSSLAEASLLSNIENETPARAAEILNILASTPIAAVPATTPNPFLTPTPDVGQHLAVPLSLPVGLSNDFIRANLFSSDFNSRVPSGLFPVTRSEPDPLLGSLIARSPTSGSSPARVTYTTGQTLLDGGGSSATSNPPSSSGSGQPHRSTAATAAVRATRLTAAMQRQCYHEIARYDRAGLLSPPSGSVNQMAVTLSQQARLTTTHDVRDALSLNA